MRPEKAAVSDETGRKEGMHSSIARRTPPSVSFIHKSPKNADTVLSPLARIPHAFSIFIRIPTLHARPTKAPRGRSRPFPRNAS